MTKKELNCLRERAELNGVRERSGVTVNPLKSSVNISLYHFSDRELDKVSPQFFGLNHYSKNEASRSGIKRAFFYDKPQPQEYLLQGSGFRYRIEIDKAKIYDLRADSQGLIDKAGGDIDKLLRLIKREYLGACYDCGFACYILFNDVQIKDRAKREAGSWRKF